MGELEDFMGAERARLAGEIAEAERKQRERRELSLSRSQEFINFARERRLGQTALYLQRCVSTRTEATLFRKAKAETHYDYTYRGWGWVIPTHPSEYIEHPDRHLIVLDTNETYMCGRPSQSSDGCPDDIVHRPYVVSGEYDASQSNTGFEFSNDMDRWVLVSAMLRVEQGGRL